MSWWKRAAAVAAVVVAFFAGLNTVLGPGSYLGATLFGSADENHGADPTTGRLDGGLNRAQTPLPGHGGPSLGFGDSAGGREVRPYTGFTATTRTPIMNSFVDVKYFVFADGDERRYMGTSTAKPGSERPRARDFARKATLHDDEVFWVRALVDNNASPVDDCTDPQGVAVAQNRGSGDDRR